MENIFKLKENGSSVLTEVAAGFTTFFAMSYIIFVNPAMLAQTGIPWGAVFLATIIASAVSTLFMGLFANVPYALAPGMGLNAFFTYTVVFGLNFTWQEALAMVFICGMVNVLITVTKFRKALIKSIPVSLQHAIGRHRNFYRVYRNQNAGAAIYFRSGRSHHLRQRDGCRELFHRAGDRQAELGAGVVGVDRLGVDHHIACETSKGSDFTGYRHNDNPRHSHEDRRSFATRRVRQSVGSL